MASLVGKTLGQYEIKDILGQGGMATVYLGYQSSIDRYVAIKVLPPHPGVDDNFKERFQLEAKTIGGLQNPRILPLYDYGTEDDVLYLVMQYVEGGTLEDRMDSGSIPADEVDRLLREIAHGLDYAHSKGIVHRDIKPANILLQDNHPLLADFGVVKMVASTENLTGTAVVGTPRYMSPEQGQGLDIDGRADVYSLAAMAYEMLTESPPYDGETPIQIILKHVKEDIPDIRDERPDLPEAMTVVFKKALAKNPDRRYQSAGAFASDFSRVLRGAGSTIDNEDTYATTNNAKPVARKATAPPETHVLPGLPADDSSSTGSSQTIIMRDSINPLVLMGGFGLMALAVVVVAALLLNDDTRPPVVTAVTITPQSAIDADPATPDPTSPAVVLAATEPGRATFGELRYSSTDALGDTASLRLNGVQPPGRATYVAWLANTETDDVLPIGQVAVDAVGTGNLVYTAEDDQMLPAIYNAIFISLETGEVGTTPQGEIAYHGKISPVATDALRTIFVSSEDGFNNGSLYDGLRTEANFAEQHSGLAARANNIGGVRTHAEHTINILRGERVDYNDDGRPENPGRGVGVYFFIDAISETLNNATSADNATIDLQVNSESMRVCIENIRGWANDVIELESAMITAATIEQARDEAALSTELMSYIIEGVDANENNIVESFEGECGLAQIPDYGVQTGNMTIVEGDLTTD